MKDKRRKGEVTEEGCREDEEGGRKKANGWRRVNSETKGGKEVEEEGGKDKEGRKGETTEEAER